MKHVGLYIIPGLQTRSFHTYIFNNASHRRMSFRIIHVKSKPYVLTSEVSKTFAAFLRLIMPPFRAMRYFQNLGQICSVKSVHKGKIHWILLFDLMQ